MNPYLYLAELFTESTSPLLFLDFDGTISRRDVIDAILEGFADPEWLEIEKEWVAGSIGSRECLCRQFDLVRATQAQLTKLFDSIDLDPGFQPLLGFCSEVGIDVHIVSDGFENYIRRMLEQKVSDQKIVRDVSVWANKLVPVSNTRWKLEFPFFTEACHDGCATCKPQVIDQVNRYGYPAIFVGDGLSDRFAVRSADTVFAKKSLAEYCRQAHIPFTEYCDLRVVADHLEQAYDAFAVSLSDIHQSPWRKAA